jgi:hypothetical protein
MVYRVLHPLIAAARERKFLAMGWPECCPGYAELMPNAEGKRLWKKFKECTIAELEQLREFHTREATKRLVKHGDDPTRYMATTIAEHIYRATSYAAEYMSRMGISGEDPADWPFPVATIEAINDLNMQQIIDGTDQPLEEPTDGET